MKHMGQVERLICDEAIRFMGQRQSASRETNLKIVLADQSEVPPTTSEVPPTIESVPASVPAVNLFEELRMKYGFKRPEPLVRVIAKPIPPSEPAPVSQPLSFSKSRVKAVARKKRASSNATSKSEEKSDASPENTETERVPLQGKASEPQSSTQEQAQTVGSEVPPEVVVKLEVEDMTPEEFERYGNTDILTY